jgi:hypothetical protein
VVVDVGTATAAADGFRPSTYNRLTARAGSVRRSRLIVLSGQIPFLKMAVADAPSGRLGPKDGGVER